MAFSSGAFTRTNGTNTGSTLWAADKAAGIKITSSHHDTHDQDLADGINSCVMKAGTNTHATSAGTNTVTLALTPAATAYSAGQTITFKAGGTCTGAVTLNVNSLGAKAVQKLGAALVANDITSNDIVTVVYDGTQFQDQVRLHMKAELRSVPVLALEQETVLNSQALMLQPQSSLVMQRTQLLLGHLLVMSISKEMLFIGLEVLMSQ